MGTLILHTWMEKGTVEPSFLHYYGNKTARLKRQRAIYYTKPKLEVLTAQPPCPNLNDITLLIMVYTQILTYPKRCSYSTLLHK